MSHAFFYLRGALGDTCLLEEQKPAITALLQGTYTDKNLEKLQGYHIFSLRLGDAARLLFTTVSVDGKKYLLVLEHLPNHEYDKSKFLRSKALAKYLEKKEAMHAAQALTFEVASVADIGLDAADQSGVLTYEPLDYCQRQVIQLDSDQAMAVNMSLPALLSGPPGSGKSALAEILMSDDVRRLSSGAQGARLLYVAASSMLVDTARKSFEETPEYIAAQDAGCEVLFWSYEDLVAFDSGLPKSAFIGKDFYLKWYKTYFKSEQVKQEDGFIPDAEMLYEEFRICSGYDEEQYYVLGRRQSFFETQDQRRVVLSAFKDYDSRGIDPQFYKMQQSDAFDFIGFDEVQNAALVQARGVMQLARQDRVVFCGDTEQCRYTRSSLDAIRRVFDIQKSEIQLRETHRASLAAASVANGMKEFQRMLVGGTLEKDAGVAIQTLGKTNKIGSAYLMRPQHLNAAAAPAWLTAPKGSSFAVVTLEAHLAEVHRLFDTANIPTLVYTMEQVEGLQFRTVMTYRLFEHPIFKAVKTRWAALEKGRGSPNHRPKDGLGHEHFNRVFNMLYTVLSRASHTVGLIEDSTHENRALHQWVSGLVNAGDFVLEAASSEDERDENWLARIEEMIQIENPMAGAIYKQKISDNPEDFIAFKAKVLATKQDQREVSDVAAEPLPTVLVRKAAPKLSPDEPNKPTRAQQRKAKKALSVEIKTSETPEALLRARKIQSSVETLFKQFTIQRLACIFKVYQSIDAIFFEAYNAPDRSEPLALIDFIQQGADRSTQFFKWVVNDVDLIMQLTEVLVGYCKQHKATCDAVFAEKCNTLMMLKKALTSYKKHLKRGETVPHCFIQESKLEKLKAYHALGGDCNVRNYENASPLYMAVCHKKKSFVEYFLTPGLDIDVNLGDEKGATPLHQATEADWEWGVDRLLAHKAIDTAVLLDGRMPPVYLALIHGYVNMAKKLLQHSSAATCKGLESGGSGIFFMLIQEKRFAMIKVLLDDGRFNPNVANEIGETPLYYAAAEGNVSIVRLLLNDSRVDPNLSAIALGATPLHVAAQEGHHDVIRALYACPRTNRNPTMNAGYDLTPMHIVLQHGKDKTVINTLLEDPLVNPNQASKQGEIPFFQAVYADVPQAIMAFMADQRVKDILPQAVTEVLAQGYQSLPAELGAYQTLVAALLFDEGVRDYYLRVLLSEQDDLLDPEYIESNPVFYRYLLHYRVDFWRRLQTPEVFGLTPERYQEVLSKILNAEHGLVYLFRYRNAATARLNGCVQYEKNMGILDEMRVQLDAMRNTDAAEAAGAAVASP